MSDNAPVPVDNSSVGLDVFGLGSLAKYLVGPIERGLGSLTSSLARRLDSSAALTSFNAWDEALKLRGYLPSVELTLGKTAEVRILADAIQQQHNREAIAAEALQEVSHAVVDLDAADYDSPETDWIDRFWKLAQNVSDSDMQVIWGRVLARRCLSGVAFSARALDFLSTLSGEEAWALNRVGAFAMIADKGTEFQQSGFIQSFEMFDGKLKEQLSWIEGRMADLMAPLEEDLFGPLGIYSESSLSHTFHVQMAPVIEFSIGSQGLKFVVPNKLDRVAHNVLGSGFKVSRLGEELFQMIGAEANQEYVTLLVEAFKIRGLNLRHV